MKKLLLILSILLFTTPLYGATRHKIITDAYVNVTAGKTLTVQDNVTITGALGTGAYATIGNYAPLASPTFTGTVTLPTATNTVPALKLPTGTNLSTTQAGALENDGTHLYFTFANSGTRYQLDQQSPTVNLTTSTTTNLTGFIKGNGSVLSADNSTYLTTAGNAASATK